MGSDDALVMLAERLGGVCATFVAHGPLTCGRSVPILDSVVVSAICARLGQKSKPKGLDLWHVFHETLGANPDIVSRMQ